MSQDTLAPLAQLPFWLFVFIADTDQQVTAAEAERFAARLADPAWCRNSDLKAALGQALTGYDGLWKTYAGLGAGMAESRLTSVLRDAFVGVAEQDLITLRADLRDLAETIAQSGANLFGAAPARKRLAAERFVGWLSEDPAGTVAVPVQSSSPVEVATSAAVPVAQLWPLVALGPEQPHFWKRGKLRVRCIEVIQETHDVRTFRFISAEEPRLFFYKPGQSMTLELMIEGKKVWRTYTISSTPSRPHTLSITVKRVPGGRVSNWLHDNLKAGDEITIDGPNGKFNCFDIPARKLLLISGGSGITPVMSMARWLCDTGAAADMVFLHNARSPADLIFEHELMLMSAQHPNFRPVLVVGQGNGLPWAGYTGFVSPELIGMVAPDFKERNVYICGPEPYMNAVRSILERMGFPMENYHMENFGGAPAKPAQPAATPAPAPVVVPAAAPSAAVPLAAAPAPTSAPVLTQAVPVLTEGAHAITHQESGSVFACTPEHTVLTAAEAAGVEIPYSCRSGNCGTCKVIKLEGQVDMESATALSEEDVKDGYILCCAARPLSNLVLSF